MVYKIICIIALSFRKQNSIFTRFYFTTSHDDKSIYHKKIY